MCLIILLFEIIRFRIEKFTAMTGIGIFLLAILLHHSSIISVYGQPDDTNIVTDCPFEGCRCVNNPIGDDISIDCISTSSKTEFPRRTNVSLVNSTRSISLLIFYGFQLDSVPDNSFADLSIKYLHLISTNVRRLTANTFNGTRYLEEFVVYGGNLETIEKDTFEPVKSTLRKLDLSNCRLDAKRMDRISPYLKPLTFLKFLFLAENSFREIKYRWFAPFEMLKELNLAKCGIEIVPGDVFKSNKFLRVIDLSENQIEKFPNVFTKSYSYRFSLQVLKLNRNLLRVVETFSDLEELLDLDLSDNQIEEIEFRTFRNLINLERLKLDNNNIRFIESDAFAANTRLRGLFLNNNYLSSVPSLQNLNELATLNIENQNGRLTSLGDFAFDTNAPSSTGRYSHLIVYMRANPITSFGDKVFCGRNHTNDTSSSAMIDVVYVDHAAIKHMDKCVLKQMRTPKRPGGFPTYVIIDDETIDETTNVTKYEDVCNCDYMEFGRINEIKLIGICRFLNLECEEKTNQTLVDDCEKKLEFKCF